MRNQGGLIYIAFTSADDNLLHFKGRPRWYNSLRTCREMWDLNNAKQREKAEIVRDAIRRVNDDFDLLENAEFDPK
ncbi:MAG: hypothetical protein ABIF19_16845 [Planctomycetota bacterium]